MSPTPSPTRCGSSTPRAPPADPVDLLLLDMNLPDGHGLGLLTGVRAAGHLCDVIAVTAARDTDVVRHAVAQGVVLYLLKPFTFATFRSKLEQYAAYREQMASAPREVVQDEVDRLLGSLRPTGTRTAAEGHERRDPARRHLRRPRPRRTACPPARPRPPSASPGSPPGATSSTSPAWDWPTGSRATAVAAAAPKSPTSGGDAPRSAGSALIVQRPVLHRPRRGSPLAGPQRTPWGA